MSAVRFRDVRKVFALKERQVVALEDISVDIQPHEFVSIVGPSGCGKSTLLLLTAGLAAPTGGSIVVGGRPVTGPITDVGIVFQRDVLFDWRTALANVMLQAEIRRLPRAAALEKARGLLHKVGLDGFEDMYPWQLSGGMRQRVAIARALALDTPILLMDEPFGALDEQTRLLMGEWLVGIRRRTRKTVVFVTHSLHEAIALSDRIVVMTARPGRIKDVLDVALPFPRDLNAPEVTELRAKLWEQVREESLKAMGGRP
jgi:NitT/TauT family transport system ATP-binding protein